MFGLDVTTFFDPKPVVQATERAAFRNFQHAAARISKDAKASIVTDDEPSPEGTPPHTKGERGHNLRTAIRFDATKDDAVIGPMASMVGEVGFLHEFGEARGDDDFPERSFMEPALIRNLDRFAQDWEGSIGE